jgi:hypothetical protein
MQQLEDRLNLVCVSSSNNVEVNGPDAVVDDSNANEGGCQEEEVDQLAETNEE